MIDSKAFSVYGKLPIFLQNIACSLAGVKMRRQRYNQDFRKAFHFLMDSEFWSEKRLLEYQTQKLRNIIQHAYDSVPYYREVLDSLCINPEDIRTTADLKMLPILNKRTLRERWVDFQSTSLPAVDRIVEHTGGTTGTALKVAFDRTTQPWQWAVWWRHRKRFGIGINDPFIVFAGRSVVPLDNMRPPFWRRNFPMRQTYISIHHITHDNLPILADYLCRRKVAYYSGYPSILYTIASYFKESGTRLPFPPRMTFTGAETLLPHQRQVIEEAFSTTVSDQYGASEQGGNISECEKFRYHVDMEFGVVEFLPIPGMPDSIRRIVCSGLHNIAMPFIRYDIGDIATVSLEKCTCGRDSPVVENIDGRIESYITTTDGRQLGRLDFLFKKSENIQEAQLIQEEISRVTFRIVKNNKYSQKDEQKLIENIHAYMGDSFAIDLDYVESIPREKNGKFRQIVSNVFRDKLHDISDKDTNSIL